MAEPMDDIILAHLQGESLTREEEEAFGRWYALPENRKRYHELMRLQAAVKASGQPAGMERREAWERFCRRIQLRTLRRTFLRCSVAAVFLLGIGAGLYFLQKPEPAAPVLARQQTVEPGKKQAVLTLSNGQKIFLTDSTGQIHTNEKGVVIRNGGQMLVYDTREEDTPAAVPNTIDVPRGGEYQLTLADGTVVWLNSESHLTYPTHFTAGTREVTLRGEAYFEVAHDAEKPFIVRTATFNVEVLGTEFNVRTYAGEPESTTLAKGSIRLESGGRSCRLNPGEQAILDQGKITIREVDPEDAVAWRYEAFSFKEQRLEDIMNELARWYDVEIFYQNASVKELHFTAWFRRSSTIREVMGILGKTRKIKVNLQGRTLTVAGL